MSLHNEKADQKRFQAESDVRTLVDAARIKGDKTRMTAARKAAAEQKKALSNIGSKHGSDHE